MATSQNEKQYRYDCLYMDIALRISNMSHDTERKVGAVIVKDNNILAFGFNGMPAGMDNECKNPSGSTKKEVIHAEANAICKLARSAGHAEGATLYSTLSPCMDCAKLILQSGIKRFVYCEPYEFDEGILLLHGNGVKINHIDRRKEYGDSAKVSRK